MKLSVTNIIPLSFLLLIGAGCTNSPELDVMIEDTMTNETSMEDTSMKDESMKDDEAMMDTSMEDSMMEKPDDAMMKEEDVMMEEKDAMMEDAMSSGGIYTDYDASKISFASKGDVVLFFHAEWCPSCRTLDADINKSLDDIPDDVLILKVDYDTEVELKKAYGVTYQHTLVQVDQDGKLIAKWPGGSTLESILEELN